MYVIGLVDLRSVTVLCVCNPVLLPPGRSAGWCAQFVTPHTHRHTHTHTHSSQAGPLAGGASVASVDDAGTLIIWDVSEGKKRHVLEGHVPGQTYFGITEDGTKVGGCGCRHGCGCVGGFGYMVVVVWMWMWAWVGG